MGGLWAARLANAVKPNLVTVILRDKDRRTGRHNEAGPVELHIAEQFKGVRDESGRLMTTSSWCRKVQTEPITTESGRAIQRS